MIYLNTVCLKLLIETIINIIVLCLALQAGGLSDNKLQESILTSRNRTIHKCDLYNVWNTLEIDIELISIRNDGKKSDVEHYPKSPYIEYNGNVI